MNFKERILFNELNLNDTDDQIVEYITNNLEKIVSQSIQKTAKDLYTVPNSIMRLSKKLGYNGFSEMKFALKEELRNETNNKNLKIKVNAHDSKGLEESIIKNKYISPNIIKSLNLIDEKAIDKVVKKICDSKSIKFLGVGDSIYFCETFSKNMRRGNKHSEFFQHRHDMIYSVENCDSKDIYFAISASGETKQIIEAAEKAKERGAFVISMTHFSDNTLVKISDLNLFYWAPIEKINNYDATYRVGIMILVRAISEAFWNEAFIKIDKL